MSQFCKNCGKELRLGEKYCRFCGVKIESHQETVPKEGTDLPGENKKVVPNESVVSSSKIKSDSKTNFGKIIWIISFVVVYSLIKTLLNPGSDAFKTSFKSSFIQTCEKAAGGISSLTVYCTCTADYMVTNYNQTQLTDISTRYKSGGKVPQEMTNAAISCSTETSYRDNFMNTCTSAGTSNALCSCVLTYLSNNFTLAQRVQMDLDYNSTKQSPQALTDAVKSCI